MKKKKKVGGKHWKIVEAYPNDPNAMDSSELVGLSVVLNCAMGKPYNKMNVYYRAWQKIQSVVNVALNDVNENG